MEELIGAAAGGGIFGLIGTFAGRALNIWERREAREDRRIQNAHELVLIDAQARVRAQETEQEIVRIQTEGSYSGLAESLRHDTSLDGTSQWVNNIRSLVRPTLTLVLGGLLGALAFVGVDEMQMTAVEAVVFSAVTAVTWWFGDRAPRASLS